MPRAFAYSTLSLLLGVILFMFTQNLIGLTGLTDAGILISLGFLLGYMNLAYLISRRFTRKTNELMYFPYLLAVFLSLPVLLLSVATSGFTTLWSLIFFAVIILTGGISGASLGIRKGLQIRHELERDPEILPEIPEDLKKGNESISRN